MRTTILLLVLLVFVSSLAVTGCVAEGENSGDDEVNQPTKMPLQGQPWPGLVIIRDNQEHVTSWATYTLVGTASQCVEPGDLITWQMFYQASASGVIVKAIWAFNHSHWPIYFVGIDSNWVSGDFGAMTVPTKGIYQDNWGYLSTIFTPGSLPFAFGGGWHAQDYLKITVNQLGTPEFTCQTDHYAWLIPS